MFRYTKQFLLLAWFAFVLSACGGSSNSGGTSTGPAAKNLKITLTPVKNSIPANTNNFPIMSGSPFMTQLNVRVTYDNGTAIPNGTEIQLRTSNVNVAPISTLDDPETTDVNEFTTMFGSIFNESAGGEATFFIHGGSESGTVSLSASAVDPQTNRTSNASIQFTVTEGPEPFDRLTVEAAKTTLPANVFNLSPEQAFGTAYMTEAVISFRDPLGHFTNPGGEESTVGVSINPVTVAAFSTLDDPETEDVNEIFVLMGSAPVDMVAGKGTIFIWADQPGIATVTVSALDPFTGAEITQQLEIEVRSGGVEFPDSIQLQGSGSNYINGSGGPQSQIIQVNVSSSGQPVPDPNGFNNVMIDISTDGNNSGEFVSGVDVNGNTVQGQSIKIDTSNGIASLKLHSGNQSNTVIVTATSDRADNNVDNGIQDPISATRSFVISDGVLFGLDITTPNLNSLFINHVDGSVVNESGIANLDGSYSITVSAIATDKGGNPALPQTIQFGLIDSPITGYPDNGPGVFVISGDDGDPQEGGSQFNAPTGQFLTAAGGVQPNDTLLVFGEEILGNEDLESSETVLSVQSQSNLTIRERFNRNDLTGNIVNDLDIFPYIIGRAVDGNIHATATIDSNGVASTELNYPVSKLGKIAAIYAKGKGAVNNGYVRDVTDVELMLYAGAASVPGTDLAPILQASPGIIPANQPTQISVCFYDAALHPIQGAAIDWAYVGGNGTGSIDGSNGSGTMTNRTGADGCAIGIAEASGVVSASDDNGFIFTSGNTSCLVDDIDSSVCIAIGNPGVTYLTATPNSHRGSGRRFSTLSIFDGNGTPLPNVLFFGECSTSGGGNLSIVKGITPSDNNGNSEVEFNVNLDGYGNAYTGQCTISTSEGSPSVIINFVGVDLCSFPTSPTPPGC
ncbi:hypothetical protein [Marinicella gelatinilytica]|uniref:hypothetical protein n=1 Tax=Marinicella gelatinilytica TaxID=2996017 RepID=UPI00226096E4|nr:hypothetical protein [Marinicella gelatinilytica]MCX7544670.1 hypothetical protein [Marinicella gelatinilytica]